MGGIVAFLWTALLLKWVSSQCPTNDPWALEATGEQCMLCVATPLTWRQALDYCNFRDGTLTGIHNDIQATVVTTCAANEVDHAWTGLLRPDNGGDNGDDEAWLDGKAMIYGQDIVVDNDRAPAPQSCFVMTTPANELNDDHCSDTHPFVCSKKPSTCLLPDEQANTNINIPTPSPTPPAGFAYSGQTVNYVCQTGYQRIGPRPRMCQEDGTWDVTAPTCIPRVCDPLNAPLNGDVDTPPERTYKAQACYSCDDGYQLDGNVIRTCDNTGNWDGTDPTCVQVCPPLEDPLHGGVSTNGYVDTSTATYECLPGYIPPIPATRTCNGGVWSGVAPTCVRDCTVPNNPTNGMAQVTQDETVRITTFTCSEGYEISGARVITCLTTGQWSTDQPTCQPSCGQLDNPANGDVSVASTTESFRAFYTCDEGYIISGSDVRVCLLSGAWSGTAPTCIAEPSCGQLTDPANGDVSVASTTEGFRAFYTCDTRYMISGADVRVCQTNSQWSGTAPTCVEAPCTATANNTDDLEENLPYIIGGAVGGAVVTGIVGAIIGAALARGTASAATAVPRTQFPAIQPGRPPAYPQMRPRLAARQPRPFRPFRP